MGNPMTEAAMPPLPEPFLGVQDQPWGGHHEVIRSAIGEEGVIVVYTAEQMSQYARTYAADLERDADRLREDCAMVYQAIGAAMLGEPCVYTQDDVVRVLDNLSAACNGDPRPHEDLLPWPAAQDAALKERAP